MPESSPTVRFANEWIAAWNSHDLDRILSHYSDDFAFSSPFIVLFMDEPSGRLKGKKADSEYWSRALAHLPDLRFELVSVLGGIQSCVIYYKRFDGRMAAEHFDFGSSGKVVRSSAHYV